MPSKNLGILLLRNKENGFGDNCGSAPQINIKYIISIKQTSSVSYTCFWWISLIIEIKTFYIALNILEMSRDLTHLFICYLLFVYPVNRY